MNHFKNLFPVVLSFIILLQCSCNQENHNNEYTLVDFAPLAKLHTKLGEPGPADWLAFHKEEGQAFADYCVSRPVCPNDTLNKIYILPIGTFNELEQNLLRTTTDYIGLFFMLEVKLLKPIPDEVISENGRRMSWETEQLNTYYIFDSILIPEFPKDAICFTAITNKDLYPDDNWNFVFGQANLTKRLGVSSYCRFFENKLDSSNYHECLERILKTSTHELCHMFSIKHCRIYKCLINGANSLPEADENPLSLCPECLAKLQWSIKFDLIKRYDLLIDFYSRNKFDKEKEFCLKSKKIMSE
jgi:archaemetzincin